AMMGFYQMLAMDQNLFYIIDTGDNGNGQPRDNRALERKPHSSVWDMGEQFGYYWSIASHAYKEVVKRSPLATSVWLGKGQHDQGRDALSIQQVVADVLKINEMSSGDTYAWRIHKMRKERGYKTPLDGHPIEALIQSGEGFGSVGFAMRGDDPFAYALATHNDGLFTKQGSKYSFPKAMAGWDNRQAGIISPDVSIVLVGDRHANQFQMTSRGYFEMCGTFDDGQQDGFELQFGYFDAPISYCRLSIPMQGTQSFPVSALFMPQHIMESAFKEYVAPVLRKEMKSMGQDGVMELLI
ncbi:MAG: hypothetical protein NDI94_01245, partial [Candidatus Woesearchaeota archaeon]|nr:hypothetical protein [Candidatus Woesearchaeota archaeon]